MKVTVYRGGSDGFQTSGQLSIVDGNDKEIFRCFTLELPWKENLNRISCIPLGIYDCEKVDLTASIPYKHISITNVPKRAGVCIHKANLVSQLKGCIAVGEKEVDINKDGHKDVINSGKTFEKLMILLPNKFKIEIK